MVLYISVRGIDRASVSVILGLGFETVLTLWYFSFHNPSGKLPAFCNGSLLFNFCIQCWFTLDIVCVSLYFNAKSRDCLSLLNYNYYSIYS